MSTEILEVEYVPDQAACTVGHHDAVWRHDGLQAHRDDRRGAHDLGAAPGGIVHQLGYDHEAGGDADPNAQPRAVRRGQSANRFNHFESRPDCAFGVVLVRPRMPEAAEDAVAHDPNDRAIEAADLLPARRLVRYHDLAQIFGVEALRKAGGIDQIAEHEGQLAPFGLKPSKVRHRHGGLPDLRRAAQVNDRRAARRAEPRAQR